MENKPDKIIEIQTWRRKVKLALEILFAKVDYFRYLCIRDFVILLFW